ncbi:MAG: hypothetical protein AAGA69_07370 [Pseudomonadota bacterium]
MTTLPLSAQFQDVTQPKDDATKPFAIRLTQKERQQLEAHAGNKPLSTYMRDRLLDAEARPRRYVRKPRVDEQALAKALGVLGQSRLASNLNQLAKAANIGALPVGPEVTADLEQACKDIHEMRSALLQALGLKAHTHSASDKGDVL